MAKTDKVDLSPVGVKNISDPNPTTSSSTEQPSLSGGDAGVVQDVQYSPIDPPEVPEVFLTQEEQAYYALSKQYEESVSSGEKLQAMLHAERLKNVQLESQLAKGLNYFSLVVLSFSFANILPLEPNFGLKALF